MPKFLSSRLIFGVVGWGCFALLAAVWYVQYGPDKQQPCPLCIIQRYLYGLVGIVSLTAWIHGPARRGTQAYAAISGALAAAGVALAAWLVTRGHTMLSCNADPIGDFVRALPPADWWPEFFFPTGGCSDVYPPVFGLVVPVWSLIGLSTILVIMAANFVMATKLREQP